MIAPEGHITYANMPVHLFRHGTATIGHGISPGVITLHYAPSPFLPTRKGDVLFRFGGLSLRFPECRLMHVSFDVDGSGMMTQVLHIADRRWKWAFGWIRGQYNLREGNNVVRPTREKNPKELAVLCFKALGETKYDVSAMPTDERPFVDWEQDPASALSALCDAFGCRVVYNPVSDMFRICKVGVGAQLPILPNISESMEIIAPQEPDNTTFIAGKSLFQDDMALVPVGKELNGEIKPLENVSWNPNPGKPWLWEEPDLTRAYPEVDPKYQKLAQECVYRMWRPKVPFKLPDGMNIESLEQILPLESHQITCRKQEDDTTERISAEVFGTFTLDTDSRGDDKPWLKTRFGILAKWSDGFSLDVTTGVVTLSKPAFTRLTSSGAMMGNNPSPYDGYPGPARLYLRTAFGSRQPKEWFWLRYKRTRKGKGVPMGTKDYTFRRDDARAILFWDYDNGGAEVDNMPGLENEADHYIDQELRKFQLLTPQTRVYPGLVPLNLDGAISQVVWNLDGTGFVTTTGSYNTEVLTPEMSYRDRWRRDKLSELIKRETEAATKPKRDG